MSIIIVGVMVGWEADMALHCARLSQRVDAWKSSSYDDLNTEEVERYESLRDRSEDCDGSTRVSDAVNMGALVIFTGEAILKIAAEGVKPWAYFIDPWNCLDFFVVAVAFIELTPMAFVFRFFPVVILRLLRLLRVFRLAKTLPRLRAIVEALISGFSAVGWIVCFILIFNFLAGATCMVLFRDNDPFHWGSLGRAMFTILRLETLDSWDQIMYLAMFGCDEYPGAYPFLLSNPHTSCKDPGAMGWIAALLLFVIAILGAYVLPTILIGIVSIKFDDESRQIEAAKEAMESKDKVVEKAKKDLPNFFHPGRMDDILAVFEVLDANEEFGVDVRLSMFKLYRQRT